MIAIAGAGIGGLTLGCALARHGIPFHIFEKAPELRPAGAGIALADNALRALDHIGLRERAHDRGAQLRRADICDPGGGVIAGIGELPFATVVMTRTELQQVLLEPVADRVECGRAVASYTQHAEGVRLRFDDGSEMDVDVLIGADGLHSAVRRTMRGEEPLRYSGQTSWRGLGNWATADGRMTESWGIGLRFGIVPLRNARVYWFAVADAPAGESDPADVRAMLRERFRGWHGPIDDVIASTPAGAILRTDICDRVPVRRWVDRRVALLGDAAHPMTPNMGMGGCQAIEDAVVLADAVARERSIAAALARYQSKRVGRANSFVARSFMLGRIAHARSRPVRWLRNRIFGAVPRGLAARAFARDLDFRL
jgi:2-polyprenyl-6-methoxyphenol hydroxylase-like FAD-dependent oxidoreductase